MKRQKTSGNTYYVGDITTGTVFVDGDIELNGTGTLGGSDLVTLSATQTLTNKTLTAPIISSISNTGTLTLPTSTDTLVGRATTDTLTNKTLTAPIISTISNTGTLTLPTSTDTLVGRATTDTLTNKTLTNPTISTFNSGKTPADTSSVQTISNKTFTSCSYDTDVVTLSSIQSLLNKTLVTPIISAISNSGATLTIPTTTTTLVGRTTTDTLTNKTLTAPSISGATLTGTTSLDTLNYQSTGLSIQYDTKTIIMGQTQWALPYNAVTSIKWTTGTGSSTTNTGNAASTIGYNNTSGAFQVTYAGLYLISWALNTATSTVNSMMTWVTKSTSSGSTSHLRYGANGGITYHAGFYTEIQGTALVPCAAGDNLVVYGYQADSGFSLDLSPRASDVLSYVQIVRLGSNT